MRFLTSALNDRTGGMLCGLALYLNMRTCDRVRTPALAADCDSSSGVVAGGRCGLARRRSKHGG